jgi:hypothetical protein
MPNWCLNRLQVNGPPDTVAEFLAATSDHEGFLSFDKLVPMPVDLRDAANGDQWYDWSIEHWGTKWDTVGAEPVLADPITPHDPDTPVGCTQIHWDFSTAWAPPSPWLATTAPSWPTLTFHLWYDEPGMGFAGLDAFAGGAHASESWSGDSILGSSCQVPACEQYCDGEPAWDRSGPESDSIFYCDDHALIEAVVRNELP